MPYKTDKQKLGNKFLSRRVKLLDCQREMLKYWHNNGSSIHSPAKMFKVSRRTIQFILFPERQELNKLHRKQRGGSKIYYDKEYHNQKTKEHRQYKYKTLKDL